MPSARAAAAAAAAAVLAAALVPWSDSPLRRLAGGDGDGPDARFDVPLDVTRLREERRRVRAGDTYVVDPSVAATASPLVQGNLKATGQLYLARGLPVQAERDADHVLTLDGRAVRVRARR